MRSTIRYRRGVMLAALLLATTTPFAPHAYAGGDWNDSQVQWKSYDEGIALAKKEKKPICLIFFTEWCPHCRNYSGVFHDPKVVEESKQFVMIRLDKDKNAELSKKFAPDGEYIPRTYFLTSDGTLDVDVERKQLGGRHDEIVVAFEEAPHRVIPFAAHRRRRRDVIGRKLEPAFDLVDRLRLHQCAFGGVVIEGEQGAAGLPRPQPHEGAPYRVDGVVGLRLLQP